MSIPEKPISPVTGWNEGTHLKTATGAKLPRYGSVRTACKMLDDCDRHTIYHLRNAGLISGYKQRSDRRNSHLRIDLLSVWEYKQRQLSGA